MENQGESLLLTLFLDNQKEQLMIALYEIIRYNLTIPFNDILILLEETKDMDIIGISMEVLYHRSMEFLSEIVQLYYTTKDIGAKLFLVMVLCIKPTMESMPKIIKIYFENEEVRPVVQDLVFHNKSYLLLGLTLYLETESISADEKVVIEDLLCTVPRKEFTSCGGSLTGTRLYEIYLGINPKRRKK